jgi:hypothetical protein
LLGACGSFTSSDNVNPPDDAASNDDSPASMTADGATDAAHDTNTPMDAGSGDGRVPSTLPECAAQRVVHLVGGVGGLAHFTQMWPLPAIIAGYQAGYAYDDPKAAVVAPGSTTDHPLYARSVGGNALWSGTGSFTQPSAFVAGTNLTHEANPAQTVIGGTTDVVAVGAIAQKPLAPPVAVIELDVLGVPAGLYGSAMNAPAATTVNDFAGAIDAIGMATNLTAAQRALLFPDPAIVNAWLEMDGGAPTGVTTLAQTLVFALNVFKAGLVGTIVAPAFDDDPHSYFGANPAQTSDQLAGVLQHFYGALAATQEPACSHDGAVVSLANNVVFIATGDTPKDPFAGAGWPDMTPGSSNFIYVRSNGWLKPGWFGSVDTMNRLPFDPATGLLSGVAKPSDDDDAARLAILFAITRGNTQAVNAVSSTPYMGAVAPAPP